MRGFFELDEAEHSGKALGSFVVVVVVCSTKKKRFIYRLIRNGVGRNRSSYSSWMRATATATTTTTTTTSQCYASGCVPFVKSNCQSTLSLKKINFPLSTTSSSWLISEKKPQHWYPRFEPRHPNHNNNNNKREISYFCQRLGQNYRFGAVLFGEARLVSVKLWGSTSLFRKKNIARVK